jgi:hypothetical protein
MDEVNIPAEIYQWAVGKSLFSALVGFGCFIFFTRYFDRRTKINWSRDVWPDIKEGNNAMGIYMGLRILACALVSVAVSLAIR